MSFHKVKSNDKFDNAEFWFTDIYYPPAQATISKFEIWGAEIRNVKNKITTAKPTTTPKTTESVNAFLKTIPSFQLRGIYNSSSPAWRDFIIMFQEISLEFRSDLEHMHMLVAEIAI